MKLFTCVRPLWCSPTFIPSRISMLRRASPHSSNSSQHRVDGDAEVGSLQSAGVASRRKEKRPPNSLLSHLLRLGQVLKKQETLSSTLSTPSAFRCSQSPSGSEQPPTRSPLLSALRHIDSGRPGSPRSPPTNPPGTYEPNPQRWFVCVVRVLLKLAVSFHFFRSRKCSDVCLSAVCSRCDRPARAHDEDWTCLRAAAAVAHGTEVDSL